MKKNNRYLIVGLGNPGAKYEHTRHNVGFDVVDKLIYSLGIPKSKDRTRFSSSFSIGHVGNNKLFIIKPQTYMNNSGIAVLKAMFFYRVSIENVLVIYDDMDINIGKIRIRKKGSGGTHNGMKSIIARLRSYDFPRIRIGIGRPSKSENTVDFVLGKATGTDKQEIDKAIDKAKDAIECFVTNGIEKAMQEYNR